MEAAISWTFGELEGVLAGVHGIDQSKRTAFQSRLKNFHRLRYPIGFSATKGKPASYSPCQIVEMALAVEMTQLGLPPERATWVLTSNRWPAFMAIRMAAATLAAHPKGFDGPSDDLLAMFLFFDPAALNPLTLHLPAKVLPDMDEAANSFFYGGIGIVRENLVNWTTGAVPRLSLINLTAMIDIVACSPYEGVTDEHAQYRLAFFKQLEAEASAVVDCWGVEAESDHVWGVLERDGVTDPKLLAQRLGISEEAAAKSVTDFENRAREHGV